MKYRKYRSIRYIFANLLSDWVVKNDLNLENSIWTFAPSSEHTLEKREFNHVEEILKIFSAANNAKLINLFLKAKNTKSQSLLSKENRRKNIENKIFLLQNNITSIQNLKQIYIFDDIATTGATLNECCKCLANTFPSIKKTCLVIAREKLRIKS